MNATQEFLNFFKDSIIQTFDDRSFVVEKDPSLIACGRLSEINWMELRDMNARGAGIFFSVNQFAGGRRGKELCTGINAYFVECDTLSIDEQWKLYHEAKIRPSIIVRSKKSLHAYWLCSNPSIGNFVKVQQGLIERFHGDPTGKDIARVLRVPSFYHNKSEEKHLVEVQWWETDVLVTEEQMLDAFPSTQETRVFAPPAGGLTQVRAQTNFWDDLSKLDNREVLRRMSGQDICNKETFTFSRRSGSSDYIIVNGKPCDAWIDENGMIGSGKGGGPCWIQWLSFYDRSKSEVAKWAQDNLLDLLSTATVSQLGNYRQNIPYSDTKKVEKKKPIRVTGAMDHLESIVEEFNAPPSPFTWGLPKLDNLLPVIENGHYIIIFGQSGSGKTLFSFYMARKNAEKVGNVLFLSLEMSTQQLLKRYVRDRGRVGKELWRAKEFDKGIAAVHLPELQHMQFAGIDEGQEFGLEEIEELLKREQPKLVFIDNLNKIQGKGRGELEVTQSVSSGLLSLTRKYKIPIVVIHHANKMPTERKKKEEAPKPGMVGNSQGKDATSFRGLSGIRGTNKTVDDADTLIEVSHIKVVPPPGCPIILPEENSTTGIAVYKDREFDALTTQFINYYEGSFYADLEEVRVIQEFENSFEGKIV